MMSDQSTFENPEPALNPAPPPAVPEPELASEPAPTADQQLLHEHHLGAMLHEHHLGAMENILAALESVAAAVPAASGVRRWTDAARQRIAAARAMTAE